MKLPAMLMAMLMALLALLPLAAAAPGDCLPPACINAHLAAFVPLVDVVAAGTPLVWASLDVLHTSTEDATGAVAAPCFNVLYNTRSRDVTFAFDAAGGLVATVGTTTRACTTAEALAPGAAVVTYNCRLHPWMVGALVVQA